MSKAVRLFLHDDIVMTMGSNVKGTPFQMRTNKIQGALINVIDLSEREDIEAVEVFIRVKTGIKYDPPPLGIPDDKKEIEIQEKIFPSESLSGMSFFRAWYRRLRDR